MLFGGRLRAAVRGGLDLGGGLGYDGRLLGAHHRRRRLDLVGCPASLGFRRLCLRKIGLARAARGAERLVLEAAQLLPIRAPLAFQIEVIADCFVEDAHRRSLRPKTNEPPVSRAGAAWLRS